MKRLTKAKKARLKELAISAYWTARTPVEAKMAGILVDIFVPNASGAKR